MSPVFFKIKLRVTILEMGYFLDHFYCQEMSILAKLQQRVGIPSHFFGQQ